MGIPVCPLRWPAGLVASGFLPRRRASALLCAPPLAVFWHSYTPLSLPSFLLCLRRLPISWGRFPSVCDLRTFVRASAPLCLTLLGLVFSCARGLPCSLPFPYNIRCPFFSPAALPAPRFFSDLFAGLGVFSAFSFLLSAMGMRCFGPGFCSSFVWGVILGFGALLVCHSLSFSLFCTCLGPSPGTLLLFLGLCFFFAFCPLRFGPSLRYACSGLNASFAPPFPFPPSGVAVFFWAFFLPGLYSYVAGLGLLSVPPSPRAWSLGPCFFFCFLLLCPCLRCPRVHAARFP